MAETAFVFSVQKAFRILDILVFEDVDRQGIGLAELSRKTDIKPNTLHNLLRTMIQSGYLMQNDQSRYLAGPKCASIGQLNRFAEGSVLRGTVRQELQEFVNSQRETAVFAILSEGNRLPLVTLDSQEAIRVDRSFLEAPLDSIYAKTTGRILVAYADPGQRRQITELWGYPGEKWQGSGLPETLESACMDIRKQGYAFEHLREADIVSLAVPVLTTSGKLLGAVGSYAPGFRCDLQKQTAMLEALRHAAAHIARGDG